MKTFDEWWAEEYGKPMPGIVTAQKSWQACAAEYQPVIADLQSRLDEVRKLAPKWRSISREVDTIARLKYQECADELLDILDRKAGS